MFTHFNYITFGFRKTTINFVSLNLYIIFHTRPPQYITAKFGNDDFDDTETNFG